MTEREFTERYALPAMLAVLYGSPAAVCAIGVALVLNGQMRGMSVLAIPVVVLVSMWQGRVESNGEHEMAKPIGLSWLAGLPLGAAAWAIAQPLSRFFG